MESFLLEEPTIWMKNKGIAKIMIDENGKVHKNKVEWDADYDGKKATLDFNMNDNGEHKVVHMDITNDDLMKLLGMASNSDALDKRLAHDFLHNESNSALPLFLADATSEKELEKIYPQLKSQESPSLSITEEEPKPTTSPNQIIQIEIPTLQRARPKSKPKETKKLLKLRKKPIIITRYKYKYRNQTPTTRGIASGISKTKPKPKPSPNQVVCTTKRRRPRKKRVNTFRKFLRKFI